MIETVHQAPGRFDLTFDDPPEEIRQLTARAYAALIVTPAPLGTNPSKLAYSDLLGLASYVGIMRGRSKDRTQISGYGPAILLTLARSTGSATVTSRPLYDGINTSWVRNNVLRLGTSENNGITVGTITSAASPSKAGKVVAGQTPLDTLEDVCRIFSREWRVNPDGTLDVGTQATLYPTASTPTTVVTPKSGGRDLNIAGLPATDFDEVDDWDDWVSTVTVNDSSEAFTGDDTTVSIPYVDPFSATALVARKVVTSRTAFTNADCDTIAAQQLARFDGVRREVSLSTETYSIADTVQAGDGVYAFDPENDLYDLANQVIYRGKPLPAIKLRVSAVRDACSSEKGYYLRSWNGSAQELHDLTPFVAFESPGVTLECGASRRLRPTTPTSL